MANSNLQNGVNANEINAATAATATPTPVAEQKEQQTAQTSRRRRSTTPPMWRVMTQARPVFDVQLKKDTKLNWPASTNL